MSMTIDSTTERLDAQSSRSAVSPAAREVSELEIVDAGEWTLPTRDSIRRSTIDDALIEDAALAARTLPHAVDAALVRFARRPNRTGALLLRNVPIGELPATPEAPDATYDKDLATELALLTVARRLGHPVGYLPEHGGRIVQNLVPTPSDANLQTSTSSRSSLMFHTETAFHPHRPRYLLLLCLRGNPEARTTLASVFDLIERLPDDAVATMFEPRFRMSVDASFLAGRANELGPARPLLCGTPHEPTFVYDADLSVGIDDEAQSVLDLIGETIAAHQSAVVLEPGDLLVVDNNVAVHGRSPFRARFDGTDRWLQRALVLADLAPSAADRDGLVITTRFGR